MRSPDYYVTFSDIDKQNVMKEDISGAQIRAGRALVDWSREDLAARCGVTVRSLARIEAGETVPRQATVLGIRRALEGAGVEFIPANGGGVGVRLVLND